MKYAQQLIIFILFFALFLYSAFYLYMIIAAASDNVKAASIAGFVTVATFIVGRYFEQQRELKQKVNIERIEIYKRFLNFYFTMFREAKENEAKSTQDMTNFIRDFQRDIILWGSDDVVRAWMDFTQVVTDEKLVSGENEHFLQKALKASGDLLIAMRRDVGYSFTTIKAGEIASMMLSFGEKERAIVSKI